MDGRAGKKKKKKHDSPSGRLKYKKGADSNIREESKSHKLDSSLDDSQFYGGTGNLVRFNF